MKKVLLLLLCAFLLFFIYSLVVTSCSASKSKEVKYIEFCDSIFNDENWVIPTEGFTVSGSDGLTINGCSELSVGVSSNTFTIFDRRTNKRVKVNYTQDTIFYNNEIYVKQYIMKTIKDGKCPKCNTKMIIKDNMFYWRGTYFSGLVCEKCNALYDNPEDSFKKHIQQTK